MLIVFLKFLGAVLEFQTSGIPTLNLCLLYRKQKNHQPEHWLMAFGLTHMEARGIAPYIVLTFNAAKKPFYIENGFSKNDLSDNHLN